MSLSNTEAQNLVDTARHDAVRQDGETRYVTGRVFLGAGMGGDGISTVAQLENTRSHCWEEDVGEKYLARVREKAQAKAKEIITQAMAQADELKRGGFEEGLREGLTAAAHEAQALREQMTNSLQQVLLAMSAQGRILLERQSRDIESLVKLAVERIVGLEMNERRSEVLSTMLTQAVESVEAERKVTLTVNPQDRELLKPLLEGVQAANPELANWTVVESANVEPGGVLLETEEGLVDNNLATRRAEVDAVLNQLSLTSVDEPEEPEHKLEEQEDHGDEPQEHV